MLMKMAGSRSCEERAFQDNRPDEQNARGPNVEVDACGGRTVCVDRQNARLCAADNRGQRCAEPGEVRWCPAVQAFVGCQAEFKRDTLRITKPMKRITDC